MAISFFTIQNYNSKLFATAGDTVSFDRLMRQMSAADVAQQQWTLMEGNSYRSFTDAGIIAAPDQAPRTVRVVNRASGLLVDAIGGHLAPQTYLQVYPSNNGPNQVWNLRASAIDGEFFCFIHSATNGDLVWDVPDESMEPLRQLYILPMWSPAEHASQIWNVHQAYTANFPVIIESKLDGTVLDVPAFSAQDGQAIQHYGKNAGLNQIWAMEASSNIASAYVIRSLSSGKVLDVPGDQPAGQPAAVHQFVAHPEEPANQLWRLRDAGGEFVKIESVFSPGFVLDAKVGGDQFMQIYHEHHPGFLGFGDNDDNQKWRLPPVSWEVQSSSDAFDVLGSF